MQWKVRTKKGLVEGETRTKLTFLWWPTIIGEYYHWLHLVKAHQRVESVLECDSSGFGGSAELRWVTYKYGEDSTTRVTDKEMEDATKHMAKSRAGNAARFLHSTAKSALPHGCLARQDIDRDLQVLIEYIDKSEPKV